jgi:hypothetical protein
MKSDERHGVTGAIGATGPYGQTGSCGPNSIWQVSDYARKAAEFVRKASKIYCHPSYSPECDKIIEPGHSLRVAMSALADIDRAFCWYANWEHDPKLFEVYEPSKCPTCGQERAQVLKQMEGMCSCGAIGICTNVESSGHRGIAGRSGWTGPNDHPQLSSMATGSCGPEGQEGMDDK